MTEPRTAVYYPMHSHLIACSDLGTCTMPKHTCEAEATPSEGLRAALERLVDASIDQFGFCNVCDGYGDTEPPDHMKGCQVAAAYAALREAGEGQRG